MTAHKDLKKRIRARQAKTGESYVTARMHVLDARVPPPLPTTGVLTAVVHKCNEQSLRIRFQGEEECVTLRTSAYQAWSVAPGQLVEVDVRKRWTWNGHEYATGTVNRGWTDVAALELTPLPLEDQGIEDLTLFEPFRRPDPYADMWEFFVSTPRRSWEFDPIAWGAGVGYDDDPEACLVCDAAEIARHDPQGARDLLMTALAADLRCIDAHAHLGSLAFERHVEKALTHYEIAVGIGDLSLGPDFPDMLIWGSIWNRPFLRALHGYGLCLWRLDRPAAALAVFERILRLNPPDNQGVRACWDDVRKGRPWRFDLDASRTGSG